MRLERLLGRGATGSVYEGVLLDARPWGMPGLRVAVKIPHAELVEDRDSRDRFLREGHLGRSLRHEGLVRVYESGLTEQGTPYLIQELVEGRTLRDLLRGQGALPEPLVRSLGSQVAEALAVLHDAGAVHRDLKPENVMLTPDHRVRLMDLGVAWLAADAWRRHGRRGFTGTPVYAAPEQFSGGDIGPHADLYSLGALLYEAATGTPPFVGESFEELMAAHLEGEPSDAGTVVPGLSPLLCELLRGLLARTPRDRPAPARGVATILEEGESSAWWRERLQRPAAARAALPAPAHGPELAGRQQELGRLEGLVDRAREGRGGAVMVIAGAGMGKTRLVEEAVGRAARGEPPLVLWGKTLPGAQGPVSDALLSHAPGAQLKSLLLELLPRRGVLLSAFAAALRGEPAPAGVEPLAPGMETKLLAEAAVALAGRQPVVWVAEDMHFAPAETWDRFAALAQAARTSPIALVGTCRPEGWDRSPLAGGEAAGDIYPLPLPELTKEELASLARSMGGGSLGSSLLEAVLEKAGGSPLFLRELVRHARWKSLEAGLSESTLAGTARGEQELEVPESIRDLMRARLEGLSRASRELLEAACVQGFSFDPRLVARVLNRNPLELHERFAGEIASTGLVGPRGSAYAFEHHLLAETLYQCLPESERAGWHRRTAEAYIAHHGLERVAVPEREPGHALSLAEHWLAAGEGRRHWEDVLHALDCLERGFGSSEMLVDLAGRAAAQLADECCEERCELELRRSPALHRLARREEERDSIREALRLAEITGDPRKRGLARLREAEMQLRVEGAKVAERTLRDALEDARAAGDADMEIEILGGLGIAAIQQGRFEEAELSLETERERSRETGNAAGEAHAVTYLAMVAMDAGRMDDALELGRRAVELRRDLGLRMGEGIALGNLGQVHAKRGEIEEAVGLLEQSLELYEQIGYRHGESATCTGLGGMRQWLGDLEESRRWFDRAAAIARADGDRATEMMTLCSLAQVDLLEGDLPSAEQRAAEALETAEARGEQRTRIRARLLLAEICAADDPGRARGHCEEARAIAEESGAGQARAEAALHLGRVLLETEPEEAVRQLRAASDAVREAALFHIGARPDAWLALLGEKDPADVTVDPRSPVAARAEIHAVLHRAGGEGEHAGRARELLERLARDLEGAARERFWEESPAARLLRG